MLVCVCLFSFSAQHYGSRKSLLLGFLGWSKVERFIFGSYLRLSSWQDEGILCLYFREMIWILHFVLRCCETMKSKSSSSPKQINVISLIVHSFPYPFISLLLLSLVFGRTILLLPAHLWIVRVVPHALALKPRLFALFFFFRGR